MPSMKENYPEDDNKKSNLVKMLGIALGYPTLILGSAIFFKELTSRNILSAGVSVSLFLFVVIGTLIQIVYYAYKKK